jgi:hypothetical protein
MISTSCRIFADVARCLLSSADPMRTHRAQKPFLVGW